MATRGIAFAGVFIVVFLFLLVVPLWIFGGGSLLYVGGRYIARSPRARYWWSVATNAASVVAGAVVSGLIVGIGLGVLGIEAEAMLWVKLAAVIVGLVVSWWVIKAMFSTSLGKAVLAWLPTAWQILFQPAVVLAIATPLIIEITEARERTLCASHLSMIGQACALYRAQNKDQLPPDLQTLIRSGSLPAGMRCPAAARRAGQPARQFDYFYFPGGAEPDSRLRIIACDFRANHRGASRNVLHIDGTIRQVSEARFQAELARPENAEFAQALRAAEGP